MEVLGVKKVEGCLEGTNVRDIFLDEAIEDRFINFLSQFGKLVINSEIEKPFFKIIVKGQYTLKGSSANKSLRVILPENAGEELIANIIKNIDSYNSIT